MEGKSWTQNTQIRRFYVYLPFDNVLQISASENDENDGSDREFFNHQIAANLTCNATEIVRFLKTYRSLGYLSKKNDGFFERKLEFFRNR